MSASGRVDPRAFTAVAIVLAVVGAWRALPGASPWPTLLDGGWYLNAGARIAREGRLVFEPHLLATSSPAARRLVISTLADGADAGLPFPDDDGRGFYDVAFAVPDAARASVVAYQPPLWSSWIASWIRWRRGPGPTGQAMDSAGNALIPWALAYLLACGAVAGAAFGPAAAALAIALAVVGPAFAYYGSTPYAELMAGSLALVGLWALLRLSRAGPRPALAGLAGLALGLSVLAKLDLLIVAAVAVAWWLVGRRPRGGRREGLALIAGVALPLAHSALLGWSVSGFYVRLNAGGVRATLLEHPAPAFAAAVALAAIALIVLLPTPPRPGSARLLRLLRRIAAVALVVAVAAGLALEYLAPGASPPSMLGTLAWLMTPLGLWTAIAGIALWLEGDSAGRSLLLAVALVTGAVLLLAPAVTLTLSPLYAARRLVPVLLPVLTAIAAGAAARAIEARSPSWLRLAAASGAVLVFVASFGAAQPLASLREFSGSGYLAHWIADQSGGQDVILFPSTLGGADAGRLAAAVWDLGDRMTAVLAAPEVDGSQLDRAIDEWRGQGRRVLMVVGSPDELPPLGDHTFDLVADNSLVTQVLAPVPELPARPAWQEMSVHVYEALDSD